MRITHLVRRSLAYYWRTHLGVVLGAALSTLVLTGALFVGDSVKSTLRRQAYDRSGKVRSAMLAGDRFFRADLATPISAAPVMLLRGSVTRADSQGRINEAQILGVTPTFWTLSNNDATTVPPSTGGDSVTLNERAAEQLRVKVGDTLILRIEKPSAFSRDAPLSGSEDKLVAIRLPVGKIVGVRDFGNFALQANQIPPYSVFLPLDLLQRRLGQLDSANLLLWRDRDLRENVLKHWQIADAALELRPLPKGAGTDLRSPRVFLDQVVAQSAPPGVKSLTYLVNEIRAGDKATPYSMATAVNTEDAKFLNESLDEGEAVISQWEADDLGVGPGAKITLKYYVMGERRQLTEKTAEFTVKAVLPMDTPGLDGAWMPDFPGLTDKENCRDWDPGFALDSERIRDKDEAYWKTYRGTPKVIIGLPQGQRLWSNRWGNLTSIRYPADISPENVAKKLQQELTPERIGFKFVPLREQALAATKAPVDFGELFLYFSFFLLAAAAALTGLLFVFSLEQRSDEAGLLLAVGWPARAVRRAFLWEGLWVAVVGSLIGVLGAFIYTHLALWALATVWRRASGGTEFAFDFDTLNAVIGFASGVVVAVVAMWLASRRQLSQSAGVLLSSTGLLESAPVRKGVPWSRILAIAFLVLAIGALFLPAARTAEGFFGIGSLLLLAGLCHELAALRQKSLATSDDAISLETVGRRNAARRRGRSLATIAVLASGVFMVIAVDAFRQHPGEGLGARTSGTGGFALVGESALPIYEDLNAPAVQQGLGLDSKKLAGVSVVPFRVREGDDASCLNLNRPMQPRLLGVRSTELTDRGAFKFAEKTGCWSDLEGDSLEAVPGIVDSTTLQYSLKQKIGDLITYTDERGEPFSVRIVASVPGTLLQGNVIISEAHFTEHFPSSGGYRYFLIDTPPDRIEPVREELSRALTDRGLQLTPATQRLAEFQAVENTYLSIFQALGGLGLLLGSVGLAIVVARNVLERRREFGLMEAVGFQTSQLRSMVLAEHRWLIWRGLLIGAVSAFLGIWPSLHQRTNGAPVREMIFLLVALAIGALFWAWLATRLALRREQLDALRSE